MTEPDPRSPNAFEKDKPGTNARTAAEGRIETLRQAGGIFVEAVKATRMPMAITDPRLPGNPIVFANQSFLALSGYGMDEVLGQQPHFLNGPETDPEDAARFLRILAEDRDGIVETVQYARNGRRFVATVLLSAFKDDAGGTLHHFLSWADVTRRNEAEGEVADLRKVQAALRDSEVRFRRIVESVTDYAIFAIDPEGMITDWLPGAEAVFGWSAEEAIGQPAEMTFVVEDRAADEPEKEMKIARREGLAPNIRWHARKDGRRVFIEGTMTLLTDESGALSGYLKIGQDVTERRRAEEHQRTLLAELQHRVRNSLAVVRSIARRTARNSASVEEMESHLEGRIDAFARVQAAVTRDPSGRIDLTMLIEEELLAYAMRESEAMTLRGPDLLLSPKTAERLSLAIHELATNAVKHGALANGGNLGVRWALDGDRFTLTWEESRLGLSGRRPSRAGFGLELLERVLPYELRAETRVDFRRTGLRFELSMPVADDPVRADATATTPPSTESPGF